MPATCPAVPPASGRSASATRRSITIRTASALNFSLNARRSHQTTFLLDPTCHLHPKTRASRASTKSGQVQSPDQSATGSPQILIHAMSAMTVLTGGVTGRLLDTECRHLGATTASNSSTQKRSVHRERSASASKILQSSFTEAPVGIEPTVGDLQSPALPLGDGAVPTLRRQNGNVSTAPRDW